jgi:tetratricopeptide (TPR) repeat protein
VILKGTDGRQESLRNGFVHWDIAFALLDRVMDNTGKRAPQSDDTVRQWYRAVIAHLQSVAMHDQTHFVRALRLFPTDPEFLFQAGCLHESLASPPVQSVIRTAVIPPGVDIGVRSERAELETAERLLRQALAQDSTFVEARLRLGRVLARLGRHADAAAELRQLSDDDFDQPENRYFAALFLGAEEEAVGRRAEARAAYLHAAEIFPQAQSPHIALSHLARDGGDRTEALARMNRVLELPLDWAERRDPFWIYHFFQGRDLDARLDELYRPFRHAGPQ